MMSKKGPSASKKSSGTLNGDKGNEVLNQEAVRLFKTQDLGYVRTMRNKTTKEVESLRRRCIGIAAEGRKVVYVDREEEQAERAEEDEERMELEEEAEAEDAEKKALRKARRKEAGKLETLLELAEKRLESLAQAEEALDLQRSKMAKTPSVGGVNKAGVKFKPRERKR